MTSENVSRWILALSLGFVLAMFGIWKFTEPDMWIGWMPMWMEGLMGMERMMWLQVIGAAEIVFAALVIIPIRLVRKTGAALIALHLIGILTQTGWNDIAVRDIGLLGSSLALFFLL